MPYYNHTNKTMDLTVSFNVTNDNKVTTDDIFMNFVKPFDVSYVRRLYISFFCIIFLCCVLGNATVIYVILRHRKMRNVTNFFLANLAVSDLCVGLFCVLPNLSTFLSPRWYLGQVMCKLYYFIQCASYTASVLILMVISLERYFAIIHPMLNKRFTHMCLLRGIVIIVWLCAALYGLPNFIAYDVYSVTDTQTNNTLEFCVQTSQWSIDMEVYSIINFFLLYVIPLLSITFIYIRISVVLWRTSQSRAGVSMRSSSFESRQGMATSRAQLVRLDNLQGHCPKCSNFMRELSSSTSSGGREVTESQANSSQTSRRCEQNGVIPKGKVWRFRHTMPNINKTEEILSVQEANTNPCLCHNIDRMAAQSQKSNNTAIRSYSFGDSPSAHTPYSRRSIMQILRGQNRPSCPANALVTRRKVIRLLICIIIAFAICVLPHHIRLLWQYWSPPASSFSYQHLLIPPTTFLFFYANSALNPFLYALLSNHFRRAFQELMPRKCCCGKSQMSRYKGRSSRYMAEKTSIVSESRFNPEYRKTFTSNGNAGHGNESRKTTTRI